jgi:hypothetical protein
MTLVAYYALHALLALVVVGSFGWRLLRKQSLETAAVKVIYGALIVSAGLILPAVGRAWQ